ncbi:thioredoxin family protein [Lacipirellula sp.]|uniref:thioredoxin family protein n=1 Tax=Lacipirellula sp. TaxID=2691419 RepID=UPI003D11C4FE
MANEYLNPGPSREEIDATTGLVLLEFGAPWCGHCQGAAPAVAEALAQFPGIKHLKVEDGPGRPLGRSFRVKLWPTLIALRDGQEVARSVRPESVESVQELLSQL